MNKICAVSLPFPGVLQVLKHGHALGLWDLRVFSQDGFTLPEADVYLMGAWSPVYETFVANEAKNAKIVVLWTSSSGEVGFEPVEAEYLARILSWDAIDKVWFGHKPLCEALGSPKGFYAPYPFDPENVMRPAAALLTESEPVMTLFAPSTMKKNMLNNMLAAQLVQRWSTRQPVLETNMRVPALLDLRHREHNWLPDEEYRALVARSSLNFICSWAETCCYQGLEAAVMGVPSVGSPAIPWLPKWAQASPDDPMEIAKTGLFAMQDSGQFRQIALNWAKQSNTELKEVIAKL